MLPYTIMPPLLVIGLKGKAGSGKDTVADYLVQKYGFEKISMAQPLKDIVSIITGWSAESLAGNTKQSRIDRDTIIHPDFNLTGRQLLQTIGTDVFRHHFDENIWIKIALRKIGEYHGLVVVPDIRFTNEAESIQSIGGQIIHIYRDMDNQEIHKHESEQSFTSPNEITIENNGSFEDLYSIIDNLFIKRV